VVIATNPANRFAGTFAGTFAGDGAGVTGVDLRTVHSQGAIGWTTNYDFLPPTSVELWGSISCLVAADVNGDGTPDLVSGNQVAYDASGTPGVATAPPRVVVDDTGKLVGALNVHDLLRAGVM
jgi:hypothetical protein